MKGKKKMKNKIRISVLFVIAPLFLAFGSADAADMLQSRLERDYGTSYQLQKFNQTLNPGAEKNRAPVMGIDGQAAQNAVEKYRKGFEKSSQTSTSYQFSIGSMGGK